MNSYRRGDSINSSARLNSTVTWLPGRYLHTRKTAYSVDMASRMATSSTALPSPRGGALLRPASDSLLDRLLFGSHKSLYSAADNKWSLVTPWWRQLELHVMNPAVIDKEVVLEARILVGCCDSPTQPCASWHTCSCNLEISKNINLRGAFFTGLNRLASLSTSPAEKVCLPSQGQRH